MGEGGIVVWGLGAGKKCHRIRGERHSFIEDRGKPQG